MAFWYGKDTIGPRLPDGPGRQKRQDCLSKGLIPGTPEFQKCMGITPPPPVIPDEPVTPVTPDTDGGMGWFDWSERLKKSYDQLMSREPGWSDAAIRAMFGTDFEKIRGQEAGTRRSLLDMLGSQGMLGTGTSTGLMKDVAWNTERGVSDLMRNLFVEKERSILPDMLQQFTAGTQYESMQEAINAARRGEGQQALMNWVMNFWKILESWGQ